MLRICRLAPRFAQLFLLFAIPGVAFPQDHNSSPGSSLPLDYSSASESLPEAPAPMLLSSIDEALSSSSQSTTPQSAAGSQQSTHEKAEQQLKEQEHQRVLGVLPSFNTSYRANAVPLTATQKIRLAFRSSIDPVTFAGALLIAGYHEAHDDYGSGFGWAAQGYGKRAGAAYLDSFDGNMIGNGFLPALLRQDPRYFRLGRGSTMRRLLYAAAAAYICKGDRTRRWQPNISNVGGNIIAGAVSNLYYPSEDSGWGQTVADGMIVTTEGSLGNIFQEFWPDISRKFLHRDPTHGLDAQSHP
ncbi:MAG: hypothetical protein P4L40_25285 [Terracidiphilus sp.]|nr:hypothetical protein [Terracidiphilus sp.]